MTTYENLWAQATATLDVTADGGVVRVRDSQDTWLCREANWNLAREALVGMAAGADCDAYSVLCGLVRGPIVSRAGTDRGSAKARRELVRAAVAASLLRVGDSLVSRYPGSTACHARFSLYGQRGTAAKATSDGTVRYDLADPERDTAISALCARIERETGTRCYPVRRDSSTLRKDGSVLSNTYEITLVRSIPRRLGGSGGSYGVHGSLWASVFSD